MAQPETCVILQPSYLPWRGYFHQIREADVFVFYDDVQYDKHGWRNRNRIKTANGPIWLTVPVRSHGAVSDGLMINAVEIEGDRWAIKHWRSIEQAYAKAPFFSMIAAAIEPLFRKSYQWLCDLDIDTTQVLADLLGLGGRTFRRSSEMGIAGSQTERLVAIAQSVGASRYVTGPAAADYLDEKQFRDAGMTLEYMRYAYGIYPQLHGPFEPSVSILDLLFMTGPEAGRHIWGNQEARLGS